MGNVVWGCLVRKEAGDKKPVSSCAESTHDLKLFQHRDQLRVKVARIGGWLPKLR